MLGSIPEGALDLSWSATWRHWADALPASIWAKAVAVRRPCLLAWAGRSRMKCTRYLRQVAPRIRVTAALRPLRSSEITSCTPRSPRRNSVQKISASEAPITMPGDTTHCAKNNGVLFTYFARQRMFIEPATFRDFRSNLFPTQRSPAICGFLQRLARPRKGPSSDTLSGIVANRESSA